MRQIKEETVTFVLRSYMLQTQTNYEKVKYLKREGPYWGDLTTKLQVNRVIINIRVCFIRIPPPTHCVHWYHIMLQVVMLQHSPVRWSDKVLDKDKMENITILAQPELMFYTLATDTVKFISICLMITFVILPWSKSTKSIALTSLGRMTSSYTVVWKHVCPIPDFLIFLYVCHTCVGIKSN